MGERARPAGLASRRIAVATLRGVRGGRRLQQAFEDALAREAGVELAGRERAFAHLMVATCLRRRGEIEAVLARFLERPLPPDSGSARDILQVGACQLLLLGTSAHAAVDTGVALARASRATVRFAGLINAVLRRVSEQGPGLLAGLDGARLDTPAWLLDRWTRAWGLDRALRIARSHRDEPALDISVKADPEGWAGRLNGLVLATGSVRLRPEAPIDSLPGYADGAWWVQDAAAALPARLFGALHGLRIADLCAAPGGKTASLAAAGARVTAVEVAADRMPRLAANLARLGLDAELVCADATQWGEPGSCDGVLLDAPCTATGTIRRHPDIPYLKRSSDIAAQARLQARLLDNACRLLRPGGTLVYCTCSLEPEEGERQIADALARHPGLEPLPVVAGEVGGEADWITPEGAVRTFPFQLADLPAGLRGIDGFFIARLRRRS